MTPLRFIWWTIGLIAIIWSFHTWEINYHIDYYNDRYTENFYCETNPLHNCSFEMLDSFDEYLTGNLTEGYELYLQDKENTWRYHARNIFIVITVMFIIFQGSRVLFQQWKKKNKKELESIGFGV